MDTPSCHVIEDHTHDPQSDWAWECRAEFAFASLRKSLPIVDGAVLWCGTGLALDPLPPPSGARAAYWERGRAAMRAKATYLAGLGGGKDAFLNELRQVEAAIGQSPIEGVDDAGRDEILALLQSDWRALRASRWGLFQHGLRGVAGVSLVAQATLGSVPFCALLCFETRACRDHARADLITGRVYPAILWELGPRGWDDQTPIAAEWSGRCLSLPIDGRYSPDDVGRVCVILRDSLAYRSIWDLFV